MSHEEFFRDYGEMSMGYLGTRANVSVEQMYQAFKDRLIDETRVRADFDNGLMLVDMESK